MKLVFLISSLMILACSESKVAGTAETENVIQADFPDSVFTQSYQYQAKINYWDPNSLGLEEFESQEVSLNQSQVSIPADAHWWFEIRGSDEVSSDSIRELYWYFGRGLDSEIPVPVFKSPVFLGFQVNRLPAREGIFFALIQGTSMIVELDGDQAFFDNLYPLDEYPIIVIYKETHDSKEYEVIEGVEIFQLERGP